MDPFKPTSATGTNAVDVNEDIVKGYPTFSLQKSSVYEENLRYGKFAHDIIK